MKKFNVTITQHSQKTYEIEADTPEEAERKVVEKWQNKEIVFTDEDISGVSVVGEEMLLNEITVISMEPGKLAKLEKIVYSPDKIREFVGAQKVAAYSFNAPICIIYDENAEEKDLPLNRALFDSNNKVETVIQGKAFICGVQNEDLCSLNDEQKKKVCGSLSILIAL